MLKLFASLIKDQRGATAIEYGLIMALMVLVILTALTAFANNSTGKFNAAFTKISDAIS